MRMEWQKKRKSLYLLFESEINIDKTYARKKNRTRSACSAQYICMIPRIMRNGTFNKRRRKWKENINKKNIRF